jgi:hypothetical protein
MLDRFRSWAGHPLWGSAVALIASPFFVWIGAPWLIIAPAFAFGLVHEWLQWSVGLGHVEPKYNWRDVLDFTLGGAFTTVFVWACLMIGKGTA